MAQNAFWQEFNEQAASLVGGERNHVANLANIASLLFHELNEKTKASQVNWAGFYLVDILKPQQLVLGPFHGLPACIRIPLGKGVCGTTATNKTTTIVPDVHEFPGHIACDSKSNSEIVVPLLKGESKELLGVIDLDHLGHNGFDEEDRIGLEKLAQILVEACDWPVLAQQQ